MPIQRSYEQFESLINDLRISAGKKMSVHKFETEVMKRFNIFSNISIKSYKTLFQRFGLVKFAGAYVILLPDEYTDSKELDEDEEEILKAKPTKVKK